MEKFFKGFIFAARGLRFAFAEQLNLKVQLVIAFAVVAAGFYFQITNVEWMVLIGAIALVISLELVNSAIESLVDLVTLERKPLAGKVKDIAAGAVLFASLVSVVMGCLIFGKYIFQ